MNTKGDVSGGGNAMAAAAKQQQQMEQMERKQQQKEAYEEARQTLLHNALDQNALARYAHVVLKKIGRREGCRSGFTIERI